MFRKTLLMLLCAPALWANDPGGGSAGVGADVTLTDNGSTVTLANGEISAVITKSNAKINSMIFNGIECVRSGGDIYFSMDGNSSYRQPSGCTYSVTTHTTDMVDISMRDAWTTESQPLDIEIHYVLRRGDTGIYAYAILDHPASYTAHDDPDGVSEWRMVWKLPDDTFENLYVDDLRSRQMPTAADYSAASSTSINEVVHLNSGILAGEDEGKYCYNARYRESPAYGHASNTNNTGVWMVFGSQEFFNDGPFKSDLAPADRILHVHFGRNHYDGSSTEVSPGEDWSKLYGPYLLYCNTNPGGADACWADARAQAEAEEAAWPYDWLTGNPDYPTAAQRGTVNGTIVLNDPLKPSLDAEGALIGLAIPSSKGFQYESKGYQHWIEVGPGGTFSIPHVRPGTYNLFCVADGVAGEYEHASTVTVTTGGTVNLGTINWNISRVGSWMAWEIGLPDRQSTEFANGDQYWEPFIWNEFTTEFSNPLTYDVSSSTASANWNYCQSIYGDSGAATGSSWPYQVSFNLSSVPPSGTARLHIAFTGSHYARMHVDVNGSNPIGSPGFFYPSNQRGNGLIRQASNAKYAYHTVDIPVSYLQTGANTIQILEGKVDVSGAHVMYDYVGLEMPSVLGGNPDDGDGDGLTDSWEQLHFKTLSQIGSEDPDEDGFTNAEEEAGNSDPNDPGSLPDTDGDLIEDAWELVYYASVYDAGPLDDTDGDGFNTWAEWKAGTSPTDNTSKPGPTAGSVSVEPVADTAVWYRGTDPTYGSTNYGSDVDIDNYAFPGVPIISLGYFRFDLSAIPGGATVDAATLTLTKASTNPQQSPQGGHSDNSDGLSPGRFAIYGLLDVAGNTAQDWAESSLTGDTSGDEFDVTDAGIDPPVDTATRTVDLDGVGEVVTSTTASISDGALLTFLQGRLDAAGDRGLSTFITDIEDGNDGKGYAFNSREAASDRPTLDVDYTAVIPVPDPDEDNDNLDDAWEAASLGTLDQDGSDNPDGDAFDNEAEESAGSDPDDFDSVPGDVDGDDLADAWEIEHFEDLDETGTGDPDGDGFNNETEETAGSDPDDIDSIPGDIDGDDLADSWELANFEDLDEIGTGDPDEDGFDNETEETAGTDPDDGDFTPEDTDGDHLADSWEVANFTGGPTPATFANSDFASHLDGPVSQHTFTAFDLTGGNAVAVILTFETTGGIGNYTIQYGTETLTQGPVATDTGAAAQTAAIFYLLNPAGNLADLVIDVSPADRFAATVVSLANVDSVGASDTDGNTDGNNDLSLNYAANDIDYLLAGCMDNGYSPNGIIPLISGDNTPLTEFGSVDGDTNPDGGTAHWGGGIGSTNSFSNAVEVSDNSNRNAAALLVFTGTPPPDPLAQTGTDDPDGDGFNNEAEETAGSDPNDIDSIPGDIDGDDLSDSWELAKFGDLDEIGTGDPDGDGFDNETEENAGSHPDNIASTPDDTDADELTDTWENTHFSGLDQDADDDYDNDGTPEWLEQALALDPKNPNERFASAIGPDGSGGFEITWPNAEGVTFTVRSTTTLDGSWTPEASYPGAASPPQGSHPVDTSGTKRFYSVEAAPAPAP